VTQHTCYLADSAAINKQNHRANAQRLNQIQGRWSAESEKHLYMAKKSEIQNESMSHMRHLMW